MEINWVRIKEAASYKYRTPYPYKQLAEDIGTTPQHLYKTSDKPHGLSLKLLAKISEVLELPPGELLQDQTKNEKYSPPPVVQESKEQYKKDSKQTKDVAIEQINIKIDEVLEALEKLKSSKPTH